MTTVEIDGKPPEITVISIEMPVKNKKWRRRRLIKHYKHTEKIVSRHVRSMEITHFDMELLSI